MQHAPAARYVPLVVLLASTACSDRGANYDPGSETGSDTSDDSDDDSDSDETTDSTTGEPEACAPAWLELLEPGDGDGVGVSPIAIAAVEAGDLFVYGAVIRDLSVHLWIGAYDAEGAQTGSTEVDAGTTLDAQLWSVDTDAAGNLVVFGRFEPLGGGEPVATVARFEPDGTETWRVALDPGVEPEPGRVGIAASPGGEIAISASLRVSDNDTDAWVARLDPSTGASTWEASWSGPFESGWSTDQGGPVAIADDGHVLALALARHDYQTFESTLLAYDGQDTNPLWTATVVHDPGANHEQELGAVAFGHEGIALTSVELHTTTQRASVITAFDAGTQLWSLRPGDLDWPVGRDFGQARLEPGADGSVAIIGEFFHDELTPELGVGTYVVHVDDVGEAGCHLQIGASDEYRRPTAAASFAGLTIAAGPAPPGGGLPTLGPGWISAIVP